MNKIICKRCMAVEKTAMWEEGLQNGDITPWKDSKNNEWDDGVVDEKLWEDGLVFCPHMRRQRTFKQSRARCLRRVGQEASESGCLVV